MHGETINNLKSFRHTFLITLYLRCQNFNLIFLPFTFIIVYIAWSESLSICTCLIALDYSPKYVLSSTNKPNFDILLSRYFVLLPSAWFHYLPTFVLVSSHV